MKRHPIDYFSLIAGLGFAVIAASTFAEQSWFTTGAWNAKWFGPIILITLGLLVLAPKRSSVLTSVLPEQTVSVPEMDSDLLAASHEELPDPLIDDL